MKSKSKKIRKSPDMTSVKLKAVGIKGGVETDGIRKGEWQIDRETRKIPGQPKTIPKRPTSALKITEGTAIAMAHDKAAGKSWLEIADKYAVAETNVQDALKKLYVNTTVGKKILKGVLLENAISTGMHARSKIKDMTGMQAAVAAGIFTDRFISLDKHTASQPEEVDFSELVEIGKEIRELSEMVGGVKELENGPKVIDVEED